MRVDSIAKWAAVAWSLLAAATSVGAAEANISIPCPRWGVGDTWETRTVDDFGTETVSSIVKSRDGSKIVIAEKRSYQMTWQDPRAARRPLPPPSVTSSEILYEIAGNDLRVRQQVGDVVQMVYEPAVPFCGQVPVHVKYQTKSSVMGGTTKGQGSITYRSIGKQKVSVPAGTFDAVLVEAHNQLSTEPSTEGALSTQSVTIRNYFADGVGAVKMIFGSKVTVPVASPSDNPQAAALLQEGIEKLAKGQDASGTMKQINAQAPSGPMETETFESSRTVELTAYRAAN